MHHFGRAATSCAAVWMRAFIKNYVLTLLFLKYVSDKHKYGGGMIELHAGTTFDDIVSAFLKSSTFLPTKPKTTIC